MVGPSLATTTVMQPTTASVHSQQLMGVTADLSEPPTWVSVDSLEPADSPRLQGLDSGHAEALAEAAGEFPPILVRRSTKRVIDGMHRLDAARRMGQREICVQFFDCSEEEAFLLAVAANVLHGLPLTLADRRAAAARIISLRPEASDRWIAELAGLAAKTVASIRHSFPDKFPTATRRMGRDGRVRPLNAAEGRRIASEFLIANPKASLRHVARNAGISVGTARDVREKIRQGADPVQPKQSADAGPGDATPISARKDSLRADYDSILKRLRQDPSLRYTESGRSVLRWLCPPRIIEAPEWQDIADSIPPHCRFDIIRVARACAHTWTEFAEELDRRNRDCG